MTDKERLQENLENDRSWKEFYQFGRTMPFGKYKGWYIYYMILRHPFYVKWVTENTGFKFSDTEMWWWKEIMDLCEEARLNNILSFLGAAVCRYGELPGNIENPHSIIE